ncbi:MAG: hypothetical protein VKJ04_04915 [Vampirovibrionales bacterium]|nr:hypothetical protein [Vampirovibrionales bacterium]
MTSIQGLNHYNKDSAAIRFSGIYANASPQKEREYSAAWEAHPEEHLLRPYATRIFRELPSMLAITRLTKDRPADVHILGASDGSEAFAYAIAFKESRGHRAHSEVKISAIDQQPYLVQLAKTGHLVCTDQERIWANDAKMNPGNPLAGKGWEQYLEQANEPDIFADLTTRYPQLGQITRDLISDISIGKGMHWYRVKQEGLPTISFKQEDMQQYVRQTRGKQSNAQVYVLANAWGYLLQNPNMAKGYEDFLKLIQNIRNNNIGKEIYLVTGQTEHHIFRQAPGLIQYLRLLGMEPVSEKELGENRDVFGRIWKLQADFPVNLNFTFE